MQGNGTVHHLVEGQHGATEQGRRHPALQPVEAAQAVVLALAAKHQVQPAQIVLAWLFNQEGVAAIPKASSEAHLLANLQAAQLPLDGGDMVQLSALANQQRLVNPDFAPLWDV